MHRAEKHCCEGLCLHLTIAHRGNQKQWKSNLGGTEPSELRDGRRRRNIRLNQQLNFLWVLLSLLSVCSVLGRCYTCVGSGFWHKDQTKLLKRHRNMDMRENKSH